MSNVALISILMPLGVFMFGVWWKIESKQDKKIDNLKLCNQHQHDRLFDKIAESDRERRVEHGNLSDKVEDIWKHLVKVGKDGGTS